MSGLRIKSSSFGMEETVNRIVAQIELEDWHIFALIDHAKEAEEKGLELRPTELILFGNPKIGTLLMQDQQISAIDLPMKALVWEDEDGKVNVACNDLQWLRKRHKLVGDDTIDKIALVIEKIFTSVSN